MDRIDIQKEVHPVDFFAIADQKSGASSEELRTKVEKARKIQQERYAQEKGLLLSEYPPVTPPSRYTFPRRNRLISSWSDKLIIIQAGKGSGALTTAEYSRKYGRKVEMKAEI